jgi:hypothetical protein
VVLRHCLEALLGQAAAGVVFRARHEQSGTVCALKELHRRAGNESLSRFKREFRAASRRDHPHCLPVYQLDSDQGRWFYTMQFVAGGSPATGRVAALAGPGPSGPARGPRSAPGHDQRLRSRRVADGRCAPSEHLGHVANAEELTSAAHHHHKSRSPAAPVTEPRSILEVPVK